MQENIILVSKAFRVEEILEAMKWAKLGFQEFMVLNLQRELVVRHPDLILFGKFPVEVSYNTRESHLMILVSDKVIYAGTDSGLHDVIRGGYLGNKVGGDLYDLTLYVEDKFLIVVNGNRGYPDMFVIDDDDTWLDDVE